MTLKSFDGSRGPREPAVSRLLSRGDLGSMTVITQGHHRLCLTHRTTIWACLGTPANSRGSLLLSTVFRVVWKHIAAVAPRGEGRGFLPVQKIDYFTPGSGDDQQHPICHSLRRSSLESPPPIHRPMKTSEQN